MDILWQQDGHTLYHGDARRMTAIADGSVALIVTSPPYFNARSYSQWPTYDAYLIDMAQAWAECYRVLCNGGRIAVNVPMGYGRPGNGGYVCIGDDTTRALTTAGFTLRGHIIWWKGPVFGTGWGSYRRASDPSLRDCHEIIIVAHKGAAKRQGVGMVDRETFLAGTQSVWHIAPVQSRRHSAIFPAEIPRRLIELYSFVGDVVLDPFVGSGTTIAVARGLGRVGIGVEMDAVYAQQTANELRRGKKWTQVRQAAELGWRQEGLWEGA